jgi:Phytoene dehydrogenase and related proteins
MTDAAQHVHDAVIVGGGHNGLTAAAYLAKAGRSVVVLERLDDVGGAAVSAQAFDGVDAWLSRYSYLVSLLPQRIIDDLGLCVRLARRRYSSYTPVPGDDSGRGLLIDHGDSQATAASFARIGAPADAARFTRFYKRTAGVARALWPTLTAPLLARGEARGLIDDDATWDAMIERPIGGFIEDSLTDDLVRGVALTDALIGTFARADDVSLDQNRCFLYHVIGGGTGDWDVPIGGMGVVTSELARAARDAGARIVTGADVVSITPDGDVRANVRGDELVYTGRTVLANVAPAVLEGLLDASAGRVRSEHAPPDRERDGLDAPRSFLAGLLDQQTDGPRHEGGWPEGAQVKVNLLLKRLPRLRDSAVDPAAAFGGTFHVNETYSQLDAAYEAAVGGDIPNPLPCEIYCHSLTDPSILSPGLAASGAQTLTVFGLHTPDRLFTADNNDAMRDRLQGAVLASLNSVLAEPIEDVLLSDAAGRPCVETKTTRDIEAALGMPGGNIFHGPLSWPFVEDDAPMATPSERWGVATAHPNVLLCGSGSRRGGGVSGLGGFAAAMALLEDA